jgi:hypothetical protein
MGWPVTASCREPQALPRLVAKALRLSGAGSLTGLA